MTKRFRVILMGIIACAGVSFAGVACMQYISSSTSSYIDMNTLELVQKEQPEDGDPIAVIKTSLGDIKAVLYPEYAPNAVENFTELAESGYYDNTYVFQSEPGVYFSAGSPNKNGDLNDDMDPEREKVEQELHQNLWPFRGALCSLVTGEDGGFWKRLKGESKILNGSRFAVLNSIDFTDDFKKELRESDSNTLVADAFIELGGVPALSQEITVFGQTYEGFDVIDKLTSLKYEKDEEEDIKIPVEDIMIETIEIGTYSSEDETGNKSVQNQNTQK
ncbi:peptidylprolyl isomerase [Porcipelethomonas sp.]|uniref:peptidylprolyl isomerase n=1 Tax=Porcipelethomonas sp. TaxID=2981675 RepID=UPI003EF3D3DA